MMVFPQCEEIFQSQRTILNAVHVSRVEGNVFCFIWGHFASIPISWHILFKHVHHYHFSRCPMVAANWERLSTGSSQRAAKAAHWYLFVSLLVRTLMKWAGTIGRKQLGLKPSTVHWLRCNQWPLASHDRQHQDRPGVLCQDASESLSKQSSLCRGPAGSWKWATVCVSQPPECRRWLSTRYFASSSRNFWNCSISLEAVKVSVATVFNLDCCIPAESLVLV